MWTDWLASTNEVPRVFYLQLVLRQQHANGHRRQRLLACIFYPWLECSLRRLDAQRMRLQPENQYPDIAADR